MRGNGSFRNRRTTDGFIEQVRHYRRRLLREENLEELVTLQPDKLRARLEFVVTRMMREEGVTLPPAERSRLVTHLIDEAVGYGPLQQLMSDPSISEIMVNGPKEIWVEQHGQLVRRDDVAFIDDEHVLQLVSRIISRLGKRLDESNPWVDARMPNGDRVNAIIPPLSLNGPTMTIRRFRAQPFTLQELTTNGSLSADIADFLAGCIRAKLNLLVAGGTGSGKTTLLNALGTFIPDSERIVVIEDSAELQIHRTHPHVLRLETRPPNVEGRGEVTIRQLVRNALRMRPDRIIVGEVRGAEALDMLQAMNTGHEGSMTTVHANSPREALSRLETMVRWSEGAQDLPLSAIREQLVGALDVIVFLDRFADGSRRVTYVSEVKGVRHGEIVVRDLFVFDVHRHDQEQREVEGRFTATGVTPASLSRIRRFGTQIPDHAFVPDYLMQEFGTAIFQNPRVTEIMVNGPDEVYIERDGKIERMPQVHFRDEEHLRTVINSIVARLGRRVDEQSPMVDARLPDGSRVNAVLHPIALEGPLLTIRRFPENPLTIDDLLRHGAISHEMVAFLEACVKAHLNVLVSGGTGSGKTTLLNILSGYIDESERIATIEDTAELQLRQPHVVGMEARPADEFGEGEVSIRDLVRNALRMRPDRILVGEVRGAEALDMIQAMNTGHEGSLSTVHANSTYDALYRLETLMLWSGVKLPIEVARNQVARAIHVVVQLNRVGGSRLVWQISEVNGIEDGDYVLSDIARFEQEGVYEEDGVVHARGRHVFTGYRPACLKKFEEQGIVLDEAAFAQEAD